MRSFPPAIFVSRIRELAADRFSRLTSTALAAVANRLAFAPRSARASVESPAPSKQHALLLRVRHPQSSTLKAGKGLGRCPAILLRVRHPQSCTLKAGKGLGRCPALLLRVRHPQSRESGTLKGRFC